MAFSDAIRIVLVLQVWLHVNKSFHEMKVDVGMVNQQKAVKKARSRVTVRTF